MAFRLEEDLLDVKEPPICFLDMKGIKIRTEGELQFALKRVPDLKLRKEKIIDEEIIPPPPPVSKKKTGFNNTPLPGSNNLEKKGDVATTVYDFENPIPTGMRSIKLRDVAQVEIDWKMLTLDRPKTQLDEEIYSRFVEMDRLKLKAMAAEAPWVLYGNRPATTLLPATAPGQKRSRKKRKGHKKSKGGGSDSDDEDDDDLIKDNAPDDDIVPPDYEEDDEIPSNIPATVFNEKFTYEHYARFIEDKDENDDADLAEETPEAPVKKDKSPSKGGVRRRRSARKKETTPKETEIKPPSVIPITVNPPSPVPPKNSGTSGTKKKTKSKSKNNDASEKGGTKSKVTTKSLRGSEAKPKGKPKTKNDANGDTTIASKKLDVKGPKRPSTPASDKKSKTKPSSSKTKKKTK